MTPCQETDAPDLALRLSEGGERRRERAGASVTSSLRRFIPPPVCATIMPACAARLRSVAGSASTLGSSSSPSRALPQGRPEIYTRCHLVGGRGESLRGTPGNPAIMWRRSMARDVLGLSCMCASGALQFHVGPVQSCGAARQWPLGGSMRWGSTAGSRARQLCSPGLNPSGGGCALRPPRRSPL